MARARYETVGHVAIDSGMLWLTDASELAEDVEGLSEQIVNDHDVPMAVLVSTGRGDGIYPVVARIVDGRLASVTITFTED